MKVVAVAGHRDTGKTSLLEAILQAIPAREDVATIKSIHHDVNFDREGTDTYRHREAGADTVVGITPSMTAEIRTEGKEDGVTVSDRLAELHSKEFDWTLVEGFKGEPIPTILVGDIEESAVKGRVLFRVPDGTAVSGSTVFERLGTVPAWTPDPTP